MTQFESLTHRLGLAPSYSSKIFSSKTFIPRWVLESDAFGPMYTEEGDDRRPPELAVWQFGAETAEVSVVCSDYTLQTFHT